jgi:hypothetical protein
MPSTYQSPFATSFNSAIRRGTPCHVVVQNIAKRTNKTPKTIFESLYKAGLCYRQKFNGQYIYWPCNGVKGNATNYKSCQVEMWQCFVDWCICNGVCTPEQLQKCCGGQNVFMNNCKKFWNKQMTTSSSTVRKTSRRRTTTGRTSKTTRKGTSRSYSFSGARLRRAA